MLTDGCGAASLIAAGMVAYEVWRSNFRFEGAHVLDFSDPSEHRLR